IATGASSPDMPVHSKNIAQVPSNSSGSLPWRRLQHIGYSPVKEICLLYYLYSRKYFCLLVLDLYFKIILKKHGE
ncbi:MAG: hypothetical protein Q7J98_05375, partial [Kiritimatiellia bacterium]|nr:hypothetical protein [Kiritimatiellia bacterium]